MRSKLWVCAMLSALIGGGVFAADYGIYFDPVSGNYFTNSNPMFSIRPVGENKHIERMEVSLNDGPFEIYKGRLKLTKEGLNTIRFRAVDPVLNWSPIQTFRVFVDLKAPTSVAHWRGDYYATENSYFVHPEAKLLIASEDDLSGIKRVLWKDNKNKEPRPFPEAGVSFRQPGEYEIQWAAIDNVGNQQPWQSLKFRVDAAPPKTELQINGISQSNQQKTYVNYGSNVSLSATDDTSGVAYTEYKINDGPVSKYTRPIVVSEAVTRLQFRSIDRVGNQEKWHSLILHQDAIPPKVDLVRHGNHVLAEGKIFAKPGFWFQAQVTDGQSGISKLMVSRQGGKLEDTPINSQFKFDKPGTYEFQLKAFDKVGNASESAPVIVVIDDTPPKTRLKARQNLVPINDIFLSGIPNSIEITGEDDGVGLKHVEISYDGKVFTPLKGTIDLATWKSVRNTLYYRGVDALGNVEPAQKITIELSTTGPKVDLFVEADGLPQVPLSKFNTKAQSAQPGVQKRLPANAPKKAN